MNIFPSFQKCFDVRYNLTEAILEQLAIKTWGESHRIMTMSGETGSGKSLASQMMARMIAENTEVPFVVDNVQFTFEGVIEKSSKIPANSTIIADESVLMSGTGMIRERYELMNLENITRKFGLNIIFVYPYANIQHPTAHLSFETICISKAEKLTKLAVKENNFYYGYIILDVSEALDNLWVEYNKRKDKFIEQIMQRKAQRLDYEKYAIYLLQDNDFYDMLVDNAKPSQLKLHARISSKVPSNLTEQEISQIVYIARRIFNKQEEREQITDNEVSDAIDRAFPNRNKNYEDFFEK